MAKIEPKEIQAKNGSSVQLRSASLLDVEAFESHVEAILENGDGMVAVPGEIQFTKEERKDWINKLIEHPDHLLLVATQDGQLIGNIDFDVGKRRRISHMGGFGISVHPDWRGQGIGSALINELISWAQTNPRLEKITLGVLASNEGAIRLYSKFGFIEEGRKTKAFKFKDGSYVDDILMARFV